MLTLIKNEFYKLLHKKSTYIIIIIAFLYALLANFIYKFYNTNNYSAVNDYFYTDINYATEFVNNYNPSEDSIDDYAYYMAYIDCYGLSKEYDVDSWQVKIIMEKYFPLDNNYYYLLQDEEKNKEEIEKVQSEMLLIIQSLLNDDWKYLANLEKEEYEKKVLKYETIIENESLSEKELINYKKEHFVAKESLELINYRLEENISYKNDYLNDAISEINNVLYPMAEYIYDSNIDLDEYKDAVSSYYENKYILEHKVDTKNEANLRGLIKNFFDEYAFFILVFGIMVAGSIVSEEFSKGTIKSLLTLPYRRTDILLAKFITSILVIPLFIALLFIFQFAIGAILFGFNSLKVPVLIYNHSVGVLEVVNAFKYFGLIFMATLPKIILLVTLAFSCSAIINSTAFSMAITFCGFIGAEFINALAYAYDIKFLDYFVTTNWDWTQFLFGGKSMYGLTFNHSFIVCISYFLIMIILAIWVFNKKNIKNI